MVPAAVVARKLRRLQPPFCEACDMQGDSAGSFEFVQFQTANAKAEGAFLPCRSGGCEDGCGPEQTFARCGEEPLPQAQVVFA